MTVAAVKAVAGALESVLVMRPQVSAVKVLTSEPTIGARDPAMSSLSGLQVWLSRGTQVACRVLVRTGRLF